MTCFTCRGAGNFCTIRRSKSEAEESKSIHLKSEGLLYLQRTFVDAKQIKTNACDMKNYKED
jgi:hypothetical protein